MKRRDFLKNSLAASTLLGLSFAAAQSHAAGKTAPRGKQEYYELRAYRLKNGANHDLLDAYLEKAAIPAWNRLGVKTVGVFTEIEPKGNPTVFVLLPYASLDKFGQATARLNADAASQKAGADYLQSPKTNPAFERIDSWLMLAFAGMPKLTLPPYSIEKRPRLRVRVFVPCVRLKKFVRLSAPVCATTEKSPLPEMEKSFKVKMSVAGNPGARILTSAPLGK